MNQFQKSMALKIMDALISIFQVLVGSGIIPVDFMATNVITKVERENRNTHLNA